MKKIVALILAVVVLFTLSVPALAAKKVYSPEKPKSYSITAYGIAGIKDGTVISVKEGEVITYTVDETKGDFTNWTIYIVSEDENGNKIYTEAVEGRDYKFAVEGNKVTILAMKELSLYPLSNIIVCANYNGVKTDPATGKASTGEKDSPKTGDASVYFAFISVLALAGIAFSAKKVLSK